MKNRIGLPLWTLALAGACVVGPGSGNAEHSAGETSPPSREVQGPTLRVATGPAAQGEPSVERELRQPSAPRDGIGATPRVLGSQPTGSIAQALEQRAERRAFEGAPPVMPHSARFGEGSKDCLECHTLGMDLAGRVAHPMSHAPLTNCVQCHVESENREFPAPELLRNSFNGLQSTRRIPLGSERPAGSPPPTIPHTISMRGECLSCHGSFGHMGLRTTHPERANCVQCHVLHGSSLPLPEEER